MAQAASSSPAAKHVSASLNRVLCIKRHLASSLFLSLKSHCGILRHCLGERRAEGGRGVALVSGLLFGVMFHCGIVLEKGCFLSLDQGDVRPASGASGVIETSVPFESPSCFFDGLALASLLSSGGGLLGVFVVYTDTMIARLLDRFDMMMFDDE